MLFHSVNLTLLLSLLTTVSAVPAPLCRKRGTSDGTAAGNSTAADTAANTAGGDTGPVDTAAGMTTGGDTGPVDTAAGMTTGGGTAAADATTEETDAGSAGGAGTTESAAKARVAARGKAAAEPSSAGDSAFAQAYTTDQIIEDPATFVADFLYWEGKFAQPGIGYNGDNGMTYDGSLIDIDSGEVLPDGSGIHRFSAASKESLHVMVLAKGLAGDPDAAKFLSPDDPGSAPGLAFDLMKQKLDTYLQFDQAFPGYGGYLPWFLNEQAAIEPTDDWVNRVPSLDNGELVWAVYGAVQALAGGNAEYQALGQDWQQWLDKTKETAAKMFYQGGGKVCAVATLQQDAAPDAQTYGCEDDVLINDPFEGEMFSWWLYLFGDLSDADKEAIWDFKRDQLASVEYEENGVGPITVGRGFWFSSHEQWKVLELPYRDVVIVERVLDNAERVRTCNSANKGIPGMFASINGLSATSGEVGEYISAAGIPSVASQKEQTLDVVAPYSVFPTVVAQRGKALGPAMAWWRTMAAAPGMQTPYGCAEAVKTDGSQISGLLSWDNKVTTVAAVMGGVADLVRDKLRADGRYETFIDVTQREYGGVFGETLQGEDVYICTPEKGFS